MSANLMRNKSLLANRHQIALNGLTNDVNSVYARTLLSAVADLNC